MTSTPTSTSTETPEPQGAPEGTPTASETRRDLFLARYEQATDGPLAIMALVFLLTFTGQVIFNQPDEWWWRLLNGFGLLLWALFVIDLVVRFTLTRHRKGFFRRHWLQCLTVVLPQLRPLLSLRAFGQNGVLAGRKNFLSSKLVVSGFAAAVLIVWVGSLLVLQYEQDAPDSQITTFGTAVWWALQTITTVGYGDNIPITVPGRIVASAVMMLGIAAVGVISASLSAQFVKGPSTPDPTQVALQQEIAELKALVTELRDRLPAKP